MGLVVPGPALLLAGESAQTGCDFGKDQKVEGGPVISQSIKCDECGAERGSANHWFELRRSRNGSPYFEAWSLEAEKPGTEHICGEKCAHSVLGNFLAALRESAKEKA